MIRFIIRRSLGALAVLIVVSFITFVIFQLAPLLSHSSPVYYYVGKIPFPPGSLQLKLLEHKYGFDLPWYQQYWHWLHGIFFGQVLSDGTTTVYCHAPCFGYSFQQNTAVGTLIWQALPVSLSLAVGAAILWLVGGVLIGTLSGLFPGSILDRAGMTTALAGVSLPIFFTGPLLLLIFEYQLKWVTNTTYAPITSNPRSGSRA